MGTHPLGVTPLKILRVWEDKPSVMNFQDIRVKQVSHRDIGEDWSAGIQEAPNFSLSEAHRDISRSLHAGGVEKYVALFSISMETTQTITREKIAGEASF